MLVKVKVFVPFADNVCEESIVTVEAFTEELKLTVELPLFAET